MRRVHKPVEVTADTMGFHRRSLVVDLHTDCLIAAKIGGLDLARRHPAPWGVTAPWMLHADIPKLREGGVDAVFFGIVTHPWPHGAYARALANIDYAGYVLRKYSADLAFAGGPGGIEAARRDGKIAVLLGVEGMHMLGGRLERIEELHGRGVRYITMAHFTSNRFVASSADPFAGNARLGARGAEAVEVMNGLGMLIDVAHTHTGVVADVCSMTSAPVIASHTAAAAIKPVFRNMTDADILAVAGTGGVIGVIYASNWLAGSRPIPHLEVVVDHADHIRKLVGVDHVALGSDWDGMIKTPDGMRDASDLPALTQLFLDRGYDHDEVEKILGLNFMRVFREVCGADERVGPGPDRS
jgi:membrane dipeptidase